MSRFCQEPTVRVLSLTLPPGHGMAQHSHEWPQLVYAVRGVITAVTDVGIWVVPPMRALLLDGGVRHSVRTAGVVAMRTLYFRPDVSPAMKSPCTVVGVPPLLRELIVSVVSSGGLMTGRAPDRTRLDLLMQLLAAIPERPLGLPMPTDERAKTLAARIMADVGTPGTLPDLARGCGASARTIERAFVDETGLTFGRWRQQARLLESLRLLGLGMQVSSVAHQVGYRSVSAFVAAFRRTLGKTPTQYFAGPR